MKYIFLILVFINFSQAAKVNYFEEVGNHFGIDPLLLWSIAKVESNHNPKAINFNSNGTKDIGIMQINTIHIPTLKRLGFQKEDLWNPRINIYMGGWVLKRCLKKHGLTVNGVTCYNGRINNNPYGLKVIKQLKKVYSKKKKDT